MYPKLLGKLVQFSAFGFAHGAVASCFLFFFFFDRGKSLLMAGVRYDDNNDKNTACNNEKYHLKVFVIQIINMTITRSCLVLLFSLISFIVLFIKVQIVLIFY